MEWIRFFTVFDADNEMVGNYRSEVNAYKHRDMLVGARVGVHIFGLMDAEMVSGEVERAILALSTPAPDGGDDA